MEKQLSLGKQIMLARQQKKLSQVELANKCNLNVRTIQRIENEKVNPRPYTLRIISEALGVTLMNEIEIENGGENDNLGVTAKIRYLYRLIETYFESHRLPYF